MIRQFVGYLKEDQNKTLVHSKQVNKPWPQFRHREVEGCIIEIRIIKKIITHLYTVPGTVLRDFLILTLLILTILGVVLLMMIIFSLYTLKHREIK